MAEDIELNPEFADEIVNPEQQFQNFRPIPVDQDEVLTFAEQYIDPEKATSQLAESVINTASVFYNIPNLTLENVKRGDSPFQQFLAKNGITEMFGKSIYPKTDAEALSLFSTVDVANNPVIEGLLEQGPESLGFSGGFFLGSKTFFTKAPPTMGIRGRVFGALGTGVTTGLITSGAANYLDQLFTGDEKVVPPNQRPQFEGGKALADFLAFMPLPYLVKKGANLGAVSFINNLRRRADLVENSGISFAADKSRTLKDIASFQKRGKFPMSLRLTGAIDKFFTTTATQFAKRPFASGMVDLSAAGGATMGRIAAEEAAPGEFFPSFGAEVGGGVAFGTGAALAQNLIVYPSTRILAAAIPAVKNLFTKGRPTEKPVGETIKGIKGFKKFRERTAIRDVLEKLEIFGENADDIIQRLEADFKDPQAYAKSGIKKAYLELAELAKDSAAIKSGSPTLMLIEATLAKRYDHLNQQKKQQLIDAQEGLVNLLVILRGTGDDEALLVASQIEDELLKDNVQTGLDNAVSNLFVAFDRLRPSVKESEDGLNFLSKRLFEIIDNQFQKGREKERELYEAVPNFTVSIFNNENQPKLLSTLANDEYIPQDPISKNTYSQKQGFKQAIALGERIKRVLGIEPDPDLNIAVPTPDRGLLKLQEQANNFSANTKDEYNKLLEIIDDPTGISTSELTQLPGAKSQKVFEDKQGDILKKYEQVVGGKRRNRVEQLLDFVSEKVGQDRDIPTGPEEDIDFAKKSLAYLRANPPFKIDTARKGYTRDQIRGINERYQKDLEVHKDTIKYFELDIDRSLSQKSRISFQYNEGISKEENVQNLTEILVRNSMDSADKAERTRLKNLSAYSKKIIEIQNRQKTLLDMTGSGDSPDAMDEPPITIKELRNLRTIINTEARKLKKDDDFDGFRRLRYIAESLREDILSLVDDANAAEFRDQLIAANKYSVALNDTFTRSAIGQKVFQTNKTGELRTPPELLYMELQGFNDAAALRIKEVEKMHNFMVEEKLLDPAEEWTKTPTYQTVLYGLLRNDKRITGLFSARDLQKNYANKDSVENIPKINKTTTDRLLNDPKAEEIFNMFPALRTDLEDVVKKENLLQSVLDENSVVIKRAQSKYAFSNLKNFESPERFISKVISSEEPIKNLNKVLQDIRSFNKGTANEQIIKLQDEDKLPNLTFEKVITSAQGIQRSVTEQITTETMEQGLRESIMGYVLTKAGLEGSGPFNPNTAFTLLFKPMKGVGGRARQSLATWMRSNRLITEQELDTFREVLGNMNKLQAQERAGTLDINSPENAFTDFYLRVTGSALGQKMQRVLVPGQVTAGGLVAETAGSKLVRRFFQAMPESLRQDALLEVMKDPAYMAQLMRDVKDEKVALSVVDFLRRKFKEAVLITTTGQLRRTAPAVKEEDVPLTDIIKEDQEQREMKRPDRASVDLPEEGFPTTQTAMVPPSGLNTRLAANVGTAPQAAPNLNQRRQFASLFPNDPISGLINAQQPTRLMQEGGVVQALKGFGNQIANKLTQPIQAKTAEIQPFLDEVKTMAEDRFGVELNGSGGMAQNPQSLLEQMQNRFSDAAQSNLTEPKDYSTVGMRPAYMPMDEDGDGIDQFGAVMPNLEKNQQTLGDTTMFTRPSVDRSPFGGRSFKNLSAGLGSFGRLFMEKGGAVPPRQVNIKGQPHMLAYITPQEGGILKLLGGSGAPGPMGIPQFGFGDGDVGDEGGDADTGTEEGGSDGPGGGNGNGSDNGSDSSTSRDMGLDSSVADMAAVMGGLSKGVQDTENVQGSINYSPVKSVPFDLLNMRDKMNKHARGSLLAGVQPSFTKDAKGNITSVTGPGAPTVGVPTNPVAAIAMLGNMLGATTTTGYNMDQGPDMGDEPDPELLRRRRLGLLSLTPQEEYAQAMQLRNRNNLFG